MAIPTGLKTFANAVASNRMVPIGGAAAVGFGMSAAALPFDASLNRDGLGGDYIADLMTGGVALVGMIASGSAGVLGYQLLREIHVGQHVLKTPKLVAGTVATVGAGALIVGGVMSTAPEE